MRKSLFPIMLIVVGLLLSACMGGGGNPTPTPTPSYAASGKVILADGTGVAGITLAISGGTSATATTGIDGTWQSSVKGSVTVTPSHDDYTFTPDKQTVTKATTNVNFTATPKDTGTPDEPYTVSGIIKDEDGNTVQPVLMTFSDGFPSEWNKSDGTWEATLKGTVVVTPQDGTGKYNFEPASITVNKTLSASAINFIAVHKPLYTVSGTVETENGNAIAGAQLNFGGFGSVVSNANGKWSKSGLFGRVSVTITHDDYIFLYSKEVSGPGENIVWRGVPKTGFATLTVGTGKQYATIQEAVDAAGEGDTVVVSPGIYEERVHIRKAITVRSEAVNEFGDVVDTAKIATTTIRQPAGESYAVYIDGGHNGATVSGFTIDAVDQDRSAIRFNYSAGTITHNVIQNASTGISISGASHVHIGENNVKNNSYSGISLGGATSGNVTIVGNKISENWTGIDATNEAINRLLIDDNDFNDNRGRGIVAEVHVGSDLGIVGNTFTWNGGGGIDIRGAGAESIFVHQNEFNEHDITSDGGGLYVGAGVGPVVLMDNTFYGITAKKGGAVYVDNTVDGPDVAESMVVDGNDERIGISSGYFIDSGGNEYNLMHPDNVAYRWTL